jgi:hypothetical protein
VIRLPLRRRDGSVRAYALLDDEDWELTMDRWSAHSAGYAYRWERQTDGSRYCQLLHRAVMRLAPHDPCEVDHKNRDRLDCRRENLRVVPKGANAQNIRRAGKSRFRGVSPHRGKWRAAVCVGGRSRWLGSYDDEVTAAVVAERERLALMPFALPDPELERALSA